MISYFSATLFIAVFGQIYEHLAYGETSNFMRFAFLAPLIGGILITFMLKKMPNLPRASFNFWNSAAATAALGCIFRGIVNLSGRTTTLDIYYWLTVVILAILAVVWLGVAQIRAKC
ncbi:MAG: hypothetical protein Q4A27_03040 [bacterium]|nr:hypothetical protein [bacterium]